MKKNRCWIWDLGEFPSKSVVRLLLLLLRKTELKAVLILHLQWAILPIIRGSMEAMPFSEFQTQGQDGGTKISLKKKTFFI